MVVIVAVIVVFALASLGIVVYYKASAKGKLENAQSEIDEALTDNAVKRKQEIAAKIRK